MPLITAPGYRLTLATYAETAAMREWVAGAMPGHEMVYAIAPVLGDHAAKHVALDLAAKGLVELFQRRSAKPHCFDYCARRLGQPVTAARSRQDVCGGSQATTRAQMAALLRILRRCASGNRPCPSNAALASELGLRRGEPGRRRVRYLLQRLVEDRRIVLTGDRRHAARAITILSSSTLCGKATVGDAV